MYATDVVVILSEALTPRYLSPVEVFYLTPGRVFGWYNRRDLDHECYACQLPNRQSVPKLLTWFWYGTVKRR